MTFYVHLMFGKKEIVIVLLKKKKRKNANISGNRNAHKSEFILEAKVNSQR